MVEVEDLWSFKYHPKSFDDMILDDEFRETLNGIMERIPNVTLVGTPGVGKGCFVDILVDYNKLDVLRVNASAETGIDNIRQRVNSFATSISLTDKPKLIYLNECDRLSPAGQDLLRQLIEDVADITRFILVCNDPNRITEALRSRCPFVVFPVPQIKEVAKHCIDILKKEGIEYNTKSVIDLVKSTGGDIRHTVNTLQLNCSNGKMRDDIQLLSVDTVYEDIIDAMRSNDPSVVRKVLRSNPIDYTKLYEHLYSILIDSDEDVFANDVCIISYLTEASYRDNIVAIKEINFMGFYINILKDGCI